MSKYVAKRIVPLIYGSPEWIVEAQAGPERELVCWCTSATHATLIAKCLTERFSTTDEIARIANSMDILTRDLSRLASEGPY